MPANNELHPLTIPAPAQPAILIQLLDLLGGEHDLPTGCAELLALDPALVLWVMSTSAQTGRNHQLPRLDAAVRNVSLQGLKRHIASEALDLLVRRQGPSEHAQSWRQALRCAFLCEALARDLAYPQPHEAYLAGLLHNLGPMPPAGWDLDHLLQERDAALARRVETWRYPGLLADALRYQHWPFQSLRDAASIVQILWAARALSEQDGRATEADIAQMLGLQTPRLSELQAEAYARAEDILEHNLVRMNALGSLQEVPLQLHKALSRFLLLEGFAAQRGELREPLATLALLATHLREAHGLVQPIYLELGDGRLTARPLPGHPPPPCLTLPTEGSDTAAVMAFQWNRPITAITVNQAGVSLLDTQLARLAGLEGVLALPIGGDTPSGVLLTCGYRGQLATLGEEQTYLAKLGRLATVERQALPTTGAGRERDGGLQVRGRQLAHEINNPLGIVKNYLALLRVKLGDDPATADELRIIQEELGRITRIVQNLAGEPSAATLAPREIDLNTLLNDLAKVAAAGLMVQKGVGIELHLDESLPKLQTDGDKLRQLLLNLLLNAVEAAPEQTSVSIETHRIVNHRLEQQAEVLVSNTGPVIAPELLTHLFEPVDSTKGGEHAGLGLAIVRDLAQVLGASVSCRSGAGRTTFQVLLPLAATASASRGDAAASAESA